ncbi:hypothetical protein V2J09_006468 [Rumex salicifolius]
MATATMVAQLQLQ